jgi:hexosaminidase
MKNIIPLPNSVVPSNGFFTLAPETTILISPGTDEIFRIGEYLSDRLKRATGYRLPVQTSSGTTPQGSISLMISRLDASLGEEGYELRVEANRMTLTARQPAGLFHGIQTIRQLFPAAIELEARQSGPWQAGAGVIRDGPRFPWRGAMLDVARHFFTADNVKRLIDQLALYKMNILHLHLTDDQGWRLMINSWPNLAKIGGSRAARGDRGGYYNQSEYRDIVSYAQARYITIIPEVEVPGHSNAALASYPELNPSGKAPDLYTGSEVGFSSVGIYHEMTYQFLLDVLRELATLTPGPYIHIGGDEAHSTPEDDYTKFIEHIQKMVQAQGKLCIGWEEIAKASLLPDTLVQYWVNGEWGLKAAQRGNKLIMSPATKSYLDMKYNPTTHVGATWTGSYVEVQDSYDWDPAGFLTELPKDAVLGVEAPLWTETIATVDDLDYMLFPRLCGIAEVGWTAAEKKSWSDFRMRLAAHGPRLAGLGINFFPSPQIPWQGVG